MTPVPCLVRPAKAGEEAALSALAVRSKAHWGYDAAFMAACVAELTVRPELIATGDVFVAACDGAIAGFHTLARISDGDVDALMFFVDPPWIGRGVGGVLFDHLRNEARRRGYRRIVIDSDPHAEGFYRRMGAAPAGSTPSGSIPGRHLPRLVYTL